MDATFQVKSGTYKKNQKLMRYLPDAFFLGKSVKYPLDVMKGKKKTVEWIWIIIQKVHSDSKLKGKISNILVNKPINGEKNNSVVIIDKNKIAEFYDRKALEKEISELLSHLRETNQVSPDNIAAIMSGVPFMIQAYTYSILQEVKQFEIMSKKHIKLLNTQRKRTGQKPLKFDNF